MDLSTLTSLGRTVDPQPTYAPEILVPLPRAPQRAVLGLSTPLPFIGSDRWTGWELGWLGAGGVPQVAVVRISVPADAPCLIESKSLKLYLNSQAREHLPSPLALQQRLQTDLSTAAGAPVGVELVLPTDWPTLLPQSRAAINIDTALANRGWSPPTTLTPQTLRARADSAAVQQLCSHLLRSNCPVTGQPDWASVYLHIEGAELEPAGLLAYLLSFHGVREFHEQCVERIWLDVWQIARPRFLSVEARYTRRGGLDINPYRASAGTPVVPDQRDWRQ